MKSCVWKEKKELWYEKFQSRNLNRFFIIILLLLSLLLCSLFTAINCKIQNFNDHARNCIKSWFNKFDASFNSSYDNLFPDSEKYELKLNWKRVELKLI